MPATDEIRRFFAQEFPQSSLTVEYAGDGRARVRQEIGDEHLRPGGTVAGPVMMAVADSATYAAVLGQIGIMPLAVTTNLTINFLRRPSPERAIIGEAQLLKVGQRLVVADVRIFSEGNPEPVAHAAVTYSIPPRSI